MRKHIIALMTGLLVCSAVLAQEHDGGGVAQQLGIDIKALAAQLIGFLLLVWLLNKFLFVPIRGLLNERARDIQNTYTKIEADKAEMEQLKTEYEARLAAAEAEGRERIQAALREAEGMKNHILDEARAHAEQIRQSTSEQLERERHKLLIELRTQVADLSIHAAEKLIGAKLDDEANRRLVDEFIQQVEVSA